MTVVASAPAASRARRRTRPLESALEILRGFSHQGPVSAEDRVQVLTPDGPLEVDPWVMGKIRVFFEEDSAGSDAVPEMLAHGIAVMIKSMIDRRLVREVRQLPRKTRAMFAAQAELMLDSALGMAIVREMQKAIDSAVQQGRMEEAKALTRFQHELRGCLAGVKQLLDEAGRQRAEVLSDNLTDQPRQEEARLMRQPDPSAREITQSSGRTRRARRVRQRAREALALLPSRTELLFVLLAILLGIWLATVKVPGLLETEIPVVTAEDLQVPELFQRVDSRFPSLFITVDTRVWESLDESEQTNRVKNLSGIILTRGFTGAWLKTADGRPVAQWLGSRGATLIPPEGGEPPPAPKLEPSPNPEPAFDAYAVVP